MYGSLIIAYLFLGGAAAGALLAVSAWSLAFHRAAARATLHPSLTAAFSALRKNVYLVGFVLLAFAMVCLLWDLGAPHRALLIFTQPRPTVLTFGAYTLTVEATIAALLAAGHLFGRPRLEGSRMLTALEILCCLGALATMTYTGVFLASNPAIAFWNTWTLVAVFVFSSLSTGISATLLIDWFTQGQTLLLRAAKPLQKWHLACLAAEAVAIGLFLAATFSNPATASARALLLSPDVLPTAAIGVLGFGIFAPAALEAFSLAQKECRTIPVADVLCLCGGVCLRYIAITCGVH